ncbi:MAG: M12 family metallo-peptidase [Gammaproteobacteria bacterium]|nr:M12 family metallo-peptidase [Gammaproteobacteria bacterium]
MPALKKQLQAAPMQALSIPAASVLTGEQAPLAKATASVATIELPLPDGEMHTFVVEESPIMAPRLAEKYPDFKTYRVISSDNSVISGRVDLVSTGFHAYLNTDKGTVFIDPERDAPGYYRSFYQHDYQHTPARFSCGTVDHSSEFAPSSVLSAENNSLQKTLARNTNQLLTYRLAVAATDQYRQKVAVGGDITNTQAEIATAINRVNQIYQRDLGIRLELIANNNLLISTDPVDNLSIANDDENLLIESVKAFIESKIRVNDYDIGHAFSTGGGGLAQFQAVCIDSIKAGGVSGISTPVGDPFYIDFVAHEMGHQFGANHSFNGTTEFCSGDNRNAATAYEPGSGSTIMAYAGICAAENVQNSSDATFHAGSITQMVNYTRSGDGNLCDITSTNSNTAPVANAGLDRTVPGQTPLQLVGSATDVDADTLLYEWDEMDVGTATTDITYGTDLGNNALFRSFIPSTNPVRILPRMSTLVSGINDRAETLPTRDRTLKFRLTVRDQNLGVDEDDMQITVDKDSGPFRIVSAASPVTLDVMQPQVIEWDTACTEQQPVNCANVDISVSTDGGISFTPVLVATPNDGAETISLPQVSSTNALIKIACTDNIFFDINDSLIKLASGTGSVLTSTGFTSSISCVSADDSSGGGGSSNVWFLLGLMLLPLASRGLARVS